MVWHYVGGLKAKVRRKGKREKKFSGGVILSLYINLVGLYDIGRRITGGKDGV